MIISIICFILLLSVIVLVHEFGHFFFAKLFGIYVYEFSIGMGPLIYSSEKRKKRKDKETIYSIRAIPIGGYCALAGEGSEGDKDLPKDRLLQNKKVWQRFLVMFFGAGNNFLLAILVFLSIGLIFGAPSLDTNISGVIDDSPASVAGLMEGDHIFSINNKSVKTMDDLQLYLAISKGETRFGVVRDGEKLAIDVNPLSEEEANKVGYSYGINYNNEIKTGFINSVKYAFYKSYSVVRQLIITLKELVIGGVSFKEFSGPVGIYSAVDQTRTMGGVVNLLPLLALLSINVGFINLLPFPAFDGGRIVFLIIEKIKGKPVKAETENLIHTIGFYLLLGLIIFVTFNDVIRLFK